VKVRSIWALLVCLLLVSGNSFATILTFDDPPVTSQDGYGPGRSYVESEYMLSTVSDPGHHGSFIRFNPEAQSFLTPNNGSVHVGISLFANPWLEKVDGGLFSLISLDIAEYSEYVVKKSFAISGLKSDGSTVHANLSLDGIFDGAGGIDDFQHYVLNWTDLVRVDFNSYGVAFDNLELTSVPSPATLLLFGTGLIMLLGSRGRYLNAK
jgi:hypothetical protein